MKRRLLFAFILIGQLTAYGQINTERVLDNGRSALYFEDYILAIQYFNQVINLKPTLTEPYYYRAVAKIQLEDFVGAEADCNKALELNPFTQNALFARGFVYKKMKKYELAKADLEKVLSYNPKNQSCLINLVEVNEQLKDYDKALQQTELLLKQKTSIKNLLIMEKCQILLQKGDSIQALETINQALKKDTTAADFWGIRGFINLKQNNTEAALADYNKAIELKTENFGCYINRGILNYQHHNYRTALSDYDRAIELDSSNTQALFNRGLLRSEVGDWNNAEKDFNRIIEQDNQYNEAYYQRAIVHLTLKNYKLAQQDFKTIIDRFPSFVPAYEGRAQAYEALGNARLAAIDKYKAQQLMEDYRNGKRKPKAEPNTKAHTADIQPSIKDKVTDFNNLTENNSGKNKYEDEIRGDIQNQKADIRIKKNYVISYYSPNDNVRKTINFNPYIQDYKDKNSSKILLSNEDVNLSQELINQHFDRINQYSEYIKQNPGNLSNYFEKSVNEALVLKMDEAVEDLNQVVNIDKDFALGYFSRANVRYKQLELLQTSAKESTDKHDLSLNSKAKLNTIVADMIIKDYTKTIEILPDFAYAWFNRGNTFCFLQSYDKAIADYTTAIKLNPHMADAYFNRGLCHLSLNEKDAGIADLSKAGELGIYQAYNLIKRFGTETQNRQL